MPTPDQRRQRREAKHAAALLTVRGIRPAPPEPRSSLKHTEVAGGNANAPGFVYFVYCAGRIKIGYATDVAARMSGIATHSPFPVTLLMTITGGIEDERRCHEMFADDRANLEWFNLSYALRNFMENNFASGTFELLANAEFGCMDFFIERAAWFKEVTAPAWAA